MNDGTSLGISNITRTLKKFGQLSKVVDTESLRLTIAIPKYTQSLSATTLLTVISTIYLLNWELLTQDSLPYFRT